MKINTDAAAAGAAAAAAAATAAALNYEVLGGAKRPLRSS